jgi:F-type H+-transporting ATPase subunit delta
MKRIQQAERDAKELFRLCFVNGLLDEDRVRQVVQRVSESRNRNRLNVLKQLRRLVEINLARRTATVVSAMPLPPATCASVQSGISRVYGPGLMISFADSPSLIGGMRIQVGSDVYDGSVQARLATLEASL